MTDKTLTIGDLEKWVNEWINYWDMKQKEAEFEDDEELVNLIEARLTIFYLVLEKIGELKASVRERIKELENKGVDRSPFKENIFPWLEEELRRLLDGSSKKEVLEGEK